jgi:hypothetical protein
VETCKEVVDVYFLVDCSKTKSWAKFPLAKQFTASLAISYAKQKSSRVGVINFSDVMQQIVTLKESEHMRPQEIGKKITEMKFLNGQQFTNEAIQLAVRDFDNQTVSLKQRKRIIIFILTAVAWKNGPDGKNDYDEPGRLAKAAADEARKKGIITYSISYDDDKIRKFDALSGDRSRTYGTTLEDMPDFAPTIGPSLCPNKTA